MEQSAATVGPPGHGLMRRPMRKEQGQTLCHPSPKKGMTGVVCRIQRPPTRASLLVWRGAGTEWHNRGTGM